MKNRVQSERKFWDSYADKYDNFIHKRLSQTYDIILDHILEDTQGSENLLEVATGTGIIAMKLSQKILNITAIDIAPEMINISKEKCSKACIKNIDFRVEDICDLSFEDKSFDTIIASNVLHLLYEPEKALKEMKRVLNDHGSMIIPTFCHGANLRSHIISRLMGLFGFKARTRWSVNSFRDFVSNNGFRIIKEQILKDKIPLFYLVAIKD